MGIKTKNIKTIKNKIRFMIRRASDLTPVMKEIAYDMKKETILNFDKEQSFEEEKWIKSKRAKEVSGKTLNKTGHLRGSITAKSGVRFARCGTNVKYAARLNYGATKGEDGIKSVTVKAHKRRLNGKIIDVKTYDSTRQFPFGNIPAYGFLGINSVMKERYKTKIRDYLLGKGGNP